VVVTSTDIVAILQRARGREVENSSPGCRRHTSGIRKVWSSPDQVRHVMLPIKPSRILQVDARMRAEQTLHQLLRCFQAVNGDRLTRPMARARRCSSPGRSAHGGRAAMTIISPACMPLVITSIPLNPLTVRLKPRGSERADAVQRLHRQFFHLGT
jgi:hypothetical protein